MLGWLIAIGVVAIIVWAVTRPTVDCPRVVLGYNCKGDKCDHSEIELAKAHRAMELR